MVTLHAAHRYYHPWWKAHAYTCYQLLVFAGRLAFAAPRLVQIIVGSRGDAVRSMPYIALARLRGCHVCLQFRTNRSALVVGTPRTLQWAFLFMWRRANVYCFLSPRLRDEFHCVVPPYTPYFIIPNPIDEAWLNKRPLLLSQRDRDLVFCGRWTAEKGIKELEEALQADELRPFICDAFVDRTSARAPPNCRLHPWITGPDVRRVIGSAKVLLLPSHAEAYPNVLLEAAACGTPFVATRLPGIVDIAEDSGGGLIHDVGDCYGLQIDALKLLTDADLWRTCSENGRKWAETHALSRIVAQWREVYSAFGISGL